MTKWEFIAVSPFSEDRRLSGSEDWEAWSRLAAEVRFAHVANTGLLYRIHPCNSVSQPTRMERSMLHAWSLIFQNPTLRPRIAHLEQRSLASVHLVLASLYYGAGNMPEVRRHLATARMHRSDIVFSKRYWGICCRLLLGRWAMSHLQPG